MTPQHRDVDEVDKVHDSSSLGEHLMTTVKNTKLSLSTTQCHKSIFEVGTSKI